MGDWLRDAATVDFETLKIESRPRHPPDPVGVAIRVPGQKPRYLAWGHRCGGNNCSWADARRALGELYASGRPVLGHNLLKFDRDVGETHLELPALPWDRYHDTMTLLFLDDPRAPDFKLKSAAERLLGEKPDERDAVVDWLVAHQPVPGVKLSPKPKSEHYAGAYVAYAPVDLVGRYAVGDVIRTEHLARHLWPRISAAKMSGAYDRERELASYILEMERQGVRVDVRRLERDVARYGEAAARLDAWLRRQLQANDDLNLDSGKQLARALIGAGLAGEDDFGYTETGEVQTNKAALAGAVKDPRVLAALKYRVQLGTCLRTFMEPWLGVALRSGGLIFTEWHTTRGEHGEGSAGARTGRMSSTPNFQNLVKEFHALFAEHARGEEAKTLPRQPVELPPLPLVRSYVVPYEEDDVLLDRDYSQQEPRILAHYEGGALLEAYQADPRRDFHTTVQKQLAERNLVLERKPVKNLNLGLIYGMGLGTLAARIGKPLDETKVIKEAVLALYPGLREMYAEMRRRAKADEPIRTWGGRVYYCEPPEWVNGRFRAYDYKLVNLLVQGSAADCTKEAMIRFHRARPKRHRLVLSVHDELVVSAPRREKRRAMALLKTTMESIEFEVLMLTEGKYSAENLQALRPYDDARGAA